MYLRTQAFIRLFPLVLLLVSLALATVGAAGPCPSPDSGGC
jgi:hypothetical protein